MEKEEEEEEEEIEKVDNAFDADEATKCLVWIREITGEDIPVESVMGDKQKVSEFFYETLKDGFLLCRLANCIVPEEMQINMKSLTFKKSSNEAFESARERARLEIFCEKMMEFGVPETLTFQIDSLYERTNLVQAYCAIRNFGMEAESRPSFTGERFWPKKAEENRRTFTEEQLRASAGVINLQMGTNKGASQSGMTFGKQRMITEK
ncbi:transgelin [Plakobranchus ocellatus]|uniref:Transgelin n=1 Tax=Plakobranchus ocellatus TaxID=259542 RepID=A0AAV4B2G5_9GAST|nr:transgelin [Plakobranchus ocellatus]